MKSWEQQPGESDSAFAHFLAYLTLGVGRTIIRAYKATHPDSEAAAVSGVWREESSKWSWRKRANNFDLSSFKDIAREAAAVYGEAIRHLGAKALAAMASEEPAMRPRDWNEALNAFGHLAGLFPSDTILGLVDAAERQGDPPPAAKSADGQGMDADGFLIEIPEPEVPPLNGDPWQCVGMPPGPPARKPGETPPAYFKRTGLYLPETHENPKPGAPPAG